MIEDIFTLFPCDLIILESRTERSLRGWEFLILKASNISFRKVLVRALQGSYHIDKPMPLRVLQHKLTTLASISELSNVTGP